jgi:hypothetical protein
LALVAALTFPLQQTNSANPEKTPVQPEQLLAWQREGPTPEEIPEEVSARGLEWFSMPRVRETARDLRCDCVRNGWRDPAERLGVRHPDDAERSSRGAESACIPGAMEGLPRNFRDCSSGPSDSEIAREQLAEALRAEERVQGSRTGFARSSDQTYVSDF